MKLFMMLVLGLVLVACTNNTEGNKDRMSREPIIYRSYIEEGGQEYLDENRVEADNTYYRGYRDE